MMKKGFIIASFAIVLMLVGLIQQPRLTRADDFREGGGAPPQGIAYWASSPTGPDFAGVRLIPFQAAAPLPTAQEQTNAQILPYLRDEFSIDNIQVSYSGMVPGAPYYVNDFSEVMVYLDPTDPNHLLGAAKFFYNPAGYDFYTGVFESYDGGLTWTELQPAGVSSYSLTSDPVTTFDELGNGYFTLLTRGPTGLDMLKKPVGGNWELPVVVDRTTSTDKQWIMGDQDPQNISPYAGNLYMSWTSFGGPVTGIVFSRSIDRNTTWSAPIQLASGDVQGSVPGVAPDGTVYVVFGRSIFFGPTPGTMEIVESSNGGLSFGAPTIAANITAIPYQFNDPFSHWTRFRTPASLPAFAVSPTNGYLYIAWSDYRNGDADIYLTRSTDGGTSWSTPLRLNSDPVGNGNDQFQPQVSVAPNGRVAVMWFDRRLPCPDLPWIPPAHVGLMDACIDTFMARSYDDGATWTGDARVSDQTWDWTLNLPIDGGGAGFIGDYQGIASNNDYDFPFWNATANLGQNAQNYQEVFVARVPVPYYNLTASTKTVTPEIVLPGGVLTYTITLENLGLDHDPAVRMTDTVPISTTYISGSLSYSTGAGGFDPSTGVITWTGGVSVGTPAVISFQVMADLSAGDGSLLTNTAQVSDGSGNLYELVAEATVNVPPTIQSTLPADGDQNIPVNSPLIVSFDQPMNPASLVVTSLPDPGGWIAIWNGTNTAVTLTHNAFAYSQAYTITIEAVDPIGASLVPGPVPNPWSFTTEAQPIMYTFVPFVSKQ